MADATPAPSAAPALPAVRVLVIDDSNTIRRSAEIFLKQGGYEHLCLPAVALAALKCWRWSVKRLLTSSHPRNWPLE